MRSSYGLAQLLRRAMGPIEQVDAHIAMLPAVWQTCARLGITDKHGVKIMPVAVAITLTTVG
jgi:hypothetical protein